jgi:hypothetical protein
LASSGEITAPCGVPTVAGVTHHADLQPFADQPDYAPVANPVLDKTEQPVSKLPIAVIFPIR